MAFEFRLPDIGEGMVEGEIVKWHVTEGDFVKEDQPMVDVMTDKATVTIPSPASGHIKQILAKEGATAKVGATLIVIETNGVSKKPFGSIQPATLHTIKESPGSIETAAQPNHEKVLATPTVRKLARDLGVNISQVKGTGVAGRVNHEDVKLASELKQSTRRDIPAPSSIPGQLKPLTMVSNISQKTILPEERVPFRGLRKRISEKMIASKQNIPHFTYVEEADFSELVALRNKTDELANNKGVKLTYLPFIMKALVASLKKYPYLNSVLDEETKELILKRYYNFGIGAATPEGLTVFVIKDVEHKSIFQLAKELKELSDKAREEKLSLPELSGGTFTITSLGLLGGLLATPIINYPEVAILGIHRIRQRPVVKNGEIVIRDMANLSLSFDHRVVDGHIGAEFTGDLIRYLEEPSLLFMEMI